jgi:hypothetical protein
MSQSETKTQYIYRSGRSHIINSALQMGPAKGKSQRKKSGLVTQKYNGLSSEGLWGSTGVGTGVRRSGCTAIAYSCNCDSLLTRESEPPVRPFFNG